MFFGQVLDVIFTNEEFIIISKNHACIIRILSDCYKTNIIMDDYKQMIGKHIKHIDTHGKIFKNHGFNCQDCKCVKIEFTDCNMYVYGVANVKNNQVFNMQVMYSSSTYVSERTYNLKGEYEELENCYDLDDDDLDNECEALENCYDLGNECKALENCYDFGEICAELEDNYIFF